MLLGDRRVVHPLPPLTPIYHRDTELTGREEGEEPSRAGRALQFIEQIRRCEHVAGKNTHNQDLLTVSPSRRICIPLELWSFVGKKGSL